VPVDTGLVWFDAPTVDSLIDLAGREALAPYCADGGPPLAGGLNLYGDLLMPLVPSTRRDAYMADTSDGPLSQDLQAARAAIWERVRQTRLSVQRLQPAVFAHFGTTREYWDMITAAPEWARTTGWTAQAAAWPEACGDGPGAVLLNAAVEGEVAATASERTTAKAATTNGKMMARAATTSGERGVGPILVVDAWLGGPLTTCGPALVAGIRTEAPLDVTPGTVLHQLAIEGGGYVTRVYGLDDDPKQVWNGPAGTFVNQPWMAWLAQIGLALEDVWPDMPPGERTLWNARLYPLTLEREESLSLSLPLGQVGEGPEGWRERWLRCERLSLEESYRRADGDQLLADLQAVEDAVAACRLHQAIMDERSAAEAAALLGHQADVIARRAKRVAARVVGVDPVTQLRGYEVLAVATGDGYWEERAFAVLREMIEDAVEGGSPPAALPDPSRSGTGAGGGSVGGDSAVRARVAAAARIDFGGGWTDTPPYSIERGGTVLNAAIALRDVHPIVAEAERLTEPLLVLESGDIEAAIAPQQAGEVLSYANPADPFALLKAAAVLCGLVPQDAGPDVSLAELLVDTGGVRVCTQTSIPRGSGLGTSSILAGAVLACLGRLLGCAPTEAQLFDQVLCLEQMMTTGGGWQDQVGGLTGGIKLVTSEPGLPQRVNIVPVALSARTASELCERLLLVYTGQQRLAKNLLQAVMGRWMARDPEMVWIQGEIARLALAMQEALISGDLDVFGALLSEHWALNKRMDAGCTNEFIDGLFADMGPYISGGKLAGAGGGGFAIVVARDRDAAQALENRLQERYGSAGVAIWPCSIPEAGIVVDVRDRR
jgi:fucokinase